MLEPTFKKKSDQLIDWLAGWPAHPEIIRNARAGIQEKVGPVDWLAGWLAGWPANPEITRNARADIQ